MTPRRRRWWAPACWAGVVVWMGIIFTLSAEHGTQSAGLSGVVVRLVRHATGGLLAGVGDDTLELVVRKCAHFLAYLLLGVLLTVAWRAWPGRPATPQSWPGRPAAPQSWPGRPATPRSGPDHPEMPRPDRPVTPRWNSWRTIRHTLIRRAWMAPLLIAIAYATTDEIHQTFVPGRDGRVTDVLIDTAGALVGIGLVVLSTRRTARRP